MKSVELVSSEKTYFSHMELIVFIDFIISCTVWGRFHVEESRISPSGQSLLTGMVMQTEVPVTEARISSCPFSATARLRILVNPRPILNS